MSTSAAGKELDLAFDNYLRVRNRFLNGEASDEQDLAAQRRYAEALAKYMLGGDASWYMGRSIGGRAR